MGQDWLILSFKSLFYLKPKKTARVKITEVNGINKSHRHFYNETHSITTFSSKKIVKMLIKSCMKHVVLPVPYISEGT